MPADSSNVEELVKQAAAGDPESWAKLVTRYRSRLRRMVSFRMDPRLQGRVDPSDVVQDVCLEAWEHLGSYAEQPGTFLVTVDGGQHWNEVPYPFDQNLYSVFFLDTLRGWASSEGGSFYSTTDGGVNWVKSQTKPPGDLVFLNIFFADENTGWVVGRSGRMVKTTDGGKSWVKLFKVKDEFKVRDVFFTDLNHGWAVGDDGVILYTADGGEEWSIVSAPLSAKLTDLVFVNNRAGWASGLSGALIKYEP